MLSTDDDTRLDIRETDCPPTQPPNGHCKPPRLSIEFSPQLTFKESMKDTLSLSQERAVILERHCIDILHRIATRYRRALVSA